MSTTPNVYFIDDSATMREVIKIAFRRENINVVAHHDAAAALGEIEKARPDIVITDVIMPETDGYEVCQFIKNHPVLSRTPVILMSGVVNRAVAERAFAVKADELLRKPFQPQDLITRVKHLLKPNGAPAPTQAAAANAAAALSSIFSSASQPRPVMPAAVPQTLSAVNGPRAVPSIAASSAPHAVPQVGAAVQSPISVAPPSPAHAAPMPAAIPISAPAAAKTATNGDSRGKVEVLRLEGLVKKLQSELAAEREYSRALEAHIKTLQESE
jgi:twitching motility two-component system response regulator PilH